MAITDTIKRAPKWAWYTTGGVGLGAVALKFYSNRDKPEEAQATPNESDMYAGGVEAASPAYGIVTPSIVPVESSPDPSGLLDSMIGGVDTLLTSTGQFWRDVWGPTQEQNANLLAGMYGQNQQLTGILSDIIGQQNATIETIASAGPAPAPIVQVTAPAPIASAPPPPPTPPAAQPNTVVRDEWITRTRTNGKNVWCNCIHVRQHAGGPPLVVSENKVANGRCWAENHPCTPV